MDLKSKIREVQDWPKPGVNFKDITTLLQDKECFKEVVDGLVNFFKDKKVDKIIAIDARGFLLATPVAYLLNAGVVLVRKPGKLPYTTIEQAYELEYGSSTFHMHNDAVLPGENLILIDDLVATGGTALAACDLAEKLGGKIVGVGCLIDLPFLGGSQKIKDRGYDFKYLVSYERE